MKKISGWCEETESGVVLRLQIQPRASKTGIAGLIGSPPRLKVRIAAPPVDGEANEELVRFLRKTLEIPVSHIRILRGETGKQKDIACAGLTRAQIVDRLGLDATV